MSRRGLLVGAVGVSAVAGLGAAGCSVQTTSDTKAGGEGTITIPDPVGPLPTGDVDIHWMSGGPGAKSEVFKRLFPAYTAKHPNLKITYDELPNAKIAEALPLQVRNNQLPDVFQLLGIPIGELVSGNKLAALDDVVPDFAAWKAAMPFGVIVAGRNEFDGKTYALPTDTSRRCNMLLFNTELMKAADVDPAAKPFDLDEFRAMAKKLTGLGQGKSYGLMVGGKGGALGGPVGEMTMLNGGPPDFDWKTGRYVYNNPTKIAVIEQFKAMLADGSFFPGWASLGDQEARAQMPLGRAAMILNGPWNFPVWANDAPDFAYGVAPMPAPTDRGFITVGLGGNSYAVSANAPKDHQQVAGDLLHFLGSEAGQQAWAQYDGSADPAWSTTAVDDVRKSGKLREKDSTAFGIFDEMVRLGPDPVIRNPKGAQAVTLAQRNVTPGVADIIQGYLLGDVANLSKALQTLSDQSESELDRAIAVARKNGAEVDRDQWVFPNWDPSKNFAQADY